MTETPFDVERTIYYTEEACYKLASAVYSKSELSLVALAYEETDDLSDLEWCHILNRLNDDVYLDAKGERTLDELQIEWGIPGKKLKVIDIPDIETLKDVVGEERLYGSSNLEDAEALLEFINW